MRFNVTLNPVKCSNLAQISTWTWKTALRPGSVLILQGLGVLWVRSEKGERLAQLHWFLPTRTVLHFCLDDFATVVRLRTQIPWITLISRHQPLILWSEVTSSEGCLLGARECVRARRSSSVLSAVTVLSTQHYPTEDVSTQSSCNSLLQEQEDTISFALLGK